MAPYSSLFDGPVYIVANSINCLVQDVFQWHTLTIVEPNWPMLQNVSNSDKMYSLTCKIQHTDLTVYIYNYTDNSQYGPICYGL